MEKKIVTMNEMKVGSFVLVEDVPCKVVSLTHSKAGKHGAAKVRMEAVGLLDGRKRSVISGADGRVEIPIIEKKNGQIISIEGNKANCMDTDTFETFEIEIPEEFQGKVNEGSQFMYWDIGVKIMKALK